MKKALALVLALVLALSLGVSAFALELVKVDLAPASGSKATVVDISKEVYQLSEDAAYKDVYLVGPEGGVFYITLDGDKEYKDIEVSGTGIVSAKLVDYDPEKFTGAETIYRVEKNGAVYTSADLSADAAAKLFESFKYLKAYHFANAGAGEYTLDASSENGKVLAKYLADNKLKVADLDEAKVVEALGANFGGYGAVTEVYDVDTTTYNYNKALAAALNNENQTSKFEVVNYNKDNVYVIELTVAENYSAAYKEGSVKVTAKEVVATDKYGRDVTENVSGSIDIISDVAIFEYEMVKWAGKTGNELVVGADKGYSDYLTALSGYGKVYNENDLRYDEATVISTTAFRMLREAKYGVSVESDGLLVTIPEVVSGQKGVNFSAYGVTYLNAKGKVAARGEAVEVVFGFYGNQTIASDFTVEANLGKDAYELREMFGEKVEEEDIITYYVVEGDKVVGQFTVDYMKDDIDEDVVLKIERKAGSTLGEYKVVLEVPTAPEGEENPNTGAESVIGV
ncbi:MAG: hypothetical protein ACI4IW_03145, partial [Oscillospiraceae bacterium]